MAEYIIHVEIATSFLYENKISTLCIFNWHFFVVIIAGASNIRKIAVAKNYKGRNPYANQHRKTGNVGKDSLKNQIKKKKGMVDLNLKSSYNIASKAAINQIIKVSLTHAGNLLICTVRHLGTWRDL